MFGVIVLVIDVSTTCMSQVKSRRQMMVLVLVWLGRFCRDVTGRQNVKVVVIQLGCNCSCFAVTDSGSKLTLQRGSVIGFVRN